MEQITIKTGERDKVKLGFLSGVEVIYCGMPNKETFSVGYKDNFGNQGYAMNVFYPKTAKTIIIKRTSFRVIDVTPEQIIIELVATT